MSEWTQIDWAALERMRSCFLEGAGGERDYWESERALASYDATFAQRIGWKWDYVLGELRRRGWSPPSGELLDWGCGTGIASRAFLDHFGTGPVTKLHLWDRSQLAMAFAARRAREKYPELAVEAALPDAATTVLISHVLTELDEEAARRLANWIAERTTTLLWVEPGGYGASRRLIQVREQLRHRMQVVAPCTHEKICGMLAAGNERHWCHHFASPPPEVFTDPTWGKFARIAGIDLRALPLSFLALDRRPPPPLPPAAARFIGRPRVYKPQALLLACDASGVQERQVAKRRLPDLFRQIKKGEIDPLQLCASQGGEIVSMEPLPNWDAPSGQTGASGSRHSSVEVNRPR